MWRWDKQKVRYAMAYFMAWCIPAVPVNTLSFHVYSWMTYNEVVRYAGMVVGTLVAVMAAMAAALVNVNKKKVTEN